MLRQQNNILHLFPVFLYLMFSVVVLCNYFYEPLPKPNPSRGAPLSAAGGLPAAPLALPPRHRIRSPPLPSALAAAAAGPAANGGLGVDAGDRRLDLQGQRWAPCRRAAVRAAPLTGVVVEILLGGA